MTVCVRPGIPSLRGRGFVAAWRATLGRAYDRGRFRVAHFSLQPNHVHLIVEASDRRALARGMIAVGTRLARAVRRIFGGRGPVLSERYHLRRLTTPREVRNALSYVLLNVRKHLAQGGIARARLPSGPDPASSGRWFDGWARVPGRVREGPSLVGRSGVHPRCVAVARTWLLAVGWRRRGLIDPREVPGRTDARDGG